MRGRSGLPSGDCLLQNQSEMLENLWWRCRGINPGWAVNQSGFLKLSQSHNYNWQPGPLCAAGWRVTLDVCAQSE